MALSNSKLQTFLELLVKDENLREKFLGQKDMDGAYEIAKNYLDGMSKEEFMAELTMIAKQSSEVNEEELSNVSGGWELFPGAGRGWDNFVKVFGKVASGALDKGIEHLEQHGSEYVDKGIDLVKNKFGGEKHPGTSRINP